MDKAELNRIVNAELTRIANQVFEWKPYGPKTTTSMLLAAANTGRVLALRRSWFKNEPGTWGLPGGTVDHGETPRRGAQREAGEETGTTPIKVVPIHVYTKPRGGLHITFFGRVNCEFPPHFSFDGMLPEHDDYRWVILGNEWPQPAHSKSMHVLRESRDRIASMTHRLKHTGEAKSLTAEL